MNGSPASDLVYLRPAIAHDGSEIVRVIGPTRPEGVPLIVYHREPTNAKSNEICDDDGCPYCYPSGLSVKRMVASDEPTRESLRAEANAKLDAIGAAKRLEVRAELAAAGVAVPKVKRKRRSREEMKAVRAGRAAHMKAVAARCEPDWLQERDELLEEILTSTETT